MIEIIGFLAGILGSISLIPEIRQALHTHHLKDVAWGMLCMFAISSFLWCLYGFHINQYPLIIFDGFHFLLTLFLIFLKFHYGRGNEPLLKVATS
ncbi:hypothetical protein HYV57_03375 [Candidatus Peregrinibacteria bacterium]|nr:hypothetical protein [Candidatus Peregrinibacteria bacterium]